MAPSQTCDPHVHYSRDGSTWCLKALKHGKRAMQFVLSDMPGARSLASEEVIAKRGASIVAVTFFA